NNSALAPAVRTGISRNAPTLSATPAAHMTAATARARLVSGVASVRPMPQIVYRPFATPPVSANANGDIVMYVSTPPTTRMISAGLAEAIADAANVGERRRARAVELRAKTREVRLEPLGVGVALFRPARAEQRAAIHDLTRAGRERGEQSELGRRQIERLARD